MIYPSGRQPPAKAFYSVYLFSSWWSIPEVGNLPPRHFTQFTFLVADDLSQWSATSRQGILLSLPF